MRCARYLCICFSPVVLLIQSFNGIINPQFKGAFKKAFSCGQWNLMTFGLKIYNLKLQYNRFFPNLFFGKNGLILDSFFFFGSVSQCGPLSHGFPVVVFLDRRHPGFWDSDSIVPVVVVRMKSYVNCLFYPACEWMGITINKLYSVLALWDGRGLCLVESDILVVFLDSILHRFASGFADVNLSALTENPVHYAILLSRVIGILKAF